MNGITPTEAKIIRMILLVAILLILIYSAIILTDFIKSLGDISGGIPNIAANIAHIY